MECNKQIEVKVEDKKVQFETIETKKESKSLRLRTGIKAGPAEDVLCW
jgi:hypothetical protein